MKFDFFWYCISAFYFFFVEMLHQLVSQKKVFIFHETLNKKTLMFIFDCEYQSTFYVVNTEQISF